MRDGRSEGQNKRVRDRGREGWRHRRKEGGDRERERERRGDKCEEKETGRKMKLTQKYDTLEIETLVEHHVSCQEKINIYVTHMILYSTHHNLYRVHNRFFL